MKIIYKQPKTKSLLHELGVQNCYFKHLTVAEDANHITKKEHHHTGFEIHMIMEGYQEYECGNMPFHVEEGTFFLIPPLLGHRFAATAPHTSKYSLTFECTPELAASLSLLDQSPYARSELSQSTRRNTFLNTGADTSQSISNSVPQCIQGPLSQRMTEIIRHIAEEYAGKKQTSGLLISNAVLELVVLFLRTLGLKEETAQTGDSEEDFRLTLAKQYIQDNIKAALSVSDVAHYCHISTKQLTRIFQKSENITPLKYIQNQRVACIEMLLGQNDLTLKEISEVMNFTNEYYFNTFFRNHAGMTPGAYRKMFGG